MLTNQNPKIAYLSMEIGGDAKMPTYSGGLGVLAGDHLKLSQNLFDKIVAVVLMAVGILIILSRTTGQMSGMKHS